MQPLEATAKETQERRMRKSKQDKDRLWNDHPHKKTPKGYRCQMDKEEWSNLFWLQESMLKQTPGTKLITNYVVTDASCMIHKY